MKIKVLLPIILIAFTAGASYAPRKISSIAIPRNLAISKFNKLAADPATPARTLVEGYDKVITADRINADQILWVHRGKTIDKLRTEVGAGAQTAPVIENSDSDALLNQLVGGESKK